MVSDSRGIEASRVTPRKRRLPEFPLHTAGAATNPLSLVSLIPATQRLDAVGGEIRGVNQTAIPRTHQEWSDGGSVASDQPITSRISAIRLMVALAAARRRSALTSGDNSSVGTAYLVMPHGLRPAGAPNCDLDHIVDVATACNFDPATAFGNGWRRSGASDDAVGF